MSLPQDRSKSTKGNLFSICRYNDSKNYLSEFPKFDMAALLRNKNKALALEDFNYMP